MKLSKIILLGAILASVSASADRCEYSILKQAASEVIVIRADRNGTDKWGQIYVPSAYLPLKDGLQAKWEDDETQYSFSYKKGVLKVKEDTAYGEHFSTDVVTDKNLTVFSNFKQKLRYLFVSETRVDCKD